MRNIPNIYCDCMYYDNEDVVCDPTPETVVELVQAITDNFENPMLFHKLRLKRKEKFLAYESPESCKKIAQRIFQKSERREK